MIPNTMPTTAVTIIPKNMAPVTFLAYRNSVSSMQNSASITGGLENSPSATRVESEFTMMPAFCRPMNTMKHPIPAVMPNLRLGGIWSRTFFLTPLTAIRKNITPDIRTATRASCHVYCRPMMMVYVKKALTPISGACATGYLAYRAMRRVPMMDMTMVAV